MSALETLTPVRQTEVYKGGLSKRIAPCWGRKKDMQGTRKDTEEAQRERERCDAVRRDEAAAWVPQVWDG